MPNCSNRTPPPPDGAMNHRPDDGRKTATSALLSPSKSPGAAMSPLVPKGNAKNEKSSDRRMYHSPVLGLKNAMSDFPSPVKSAGTILSVDVPNVRANVCASPLRFIHH